MEPIDPLSQLASCCFGRRPRGAAGGFKTAAIRNQYYYSPSMAHMNPHAMGTWPMTASGPSAFFGSLQPQVIPAQPYLLLTQPVILTGQTAQSTVPTAIQQQQQQQQQQQANNTLALVQQRSKTPLQSGQLQAISFMNTNPSPLHKVPSLLPSQYALYANSSGAANLIGDFSPAQHLYTTTEPGAAAATIYESPRIGNVVRNISTYMNPQVSLTQQAAANPRRQQCFPSINNYQGMNFVTERQNIDYLQIQQQQAQQEHRRRRRLNADVFRKLEIIEKQVDLSGDMELVERHGIVLTRAIEKSSLVPHLTDEMLSRYQYTSMLDDDHVIKIIEIIKRPGQTLGLYIRAVQFENRRTKEAREGIVITKIESDSPVYTSQVLHIGDEILSINLIDINEMSLDDVVTLMSIPKRLVLVLRIPKDREYSSHLGGHHEMAKQQMLRNVSGQDEFQFARSPLTASERHDQFVMEHGSSSGKQKLDSLYNDRPEPSRIPMGFSQSISPPNVALDQTLLSHHQDNRPENYNMTSNEHAIIRPVRVQSAFHMNDASNEKAPNVASFNGGTENQQNEINTDCLSGMSTPTDTLKQLHNDPIDLSPSRNTTSRPVISNIRLGDTPEQSSYFSSSIDAINRELKELRRQRIALSNADTNASTGDWDNLYLFQS